MLRVMEVSWSSSTPSRKYVLLISAYWIVFILYLWTGNSRIGAGEGASLLGVGASGSQPVKPSFAVSPFQMGSQPAATAPSPFQLSGATSTLPSFGNLSAQLGSQTPYPFAPSTQAPPASVKPVVLNVPKVQPTFGLGTTLASGSGLIGGNSAAKTDSVPSSSTGSVAQGEDCIQPFWVDYLCFIDDPGVYARVTGHSIRTQLDLTSFLE